MNLAIYNQLQQVEASLQKDLRDLIISEIEKNNGRITYQPKQEEDEELSLDEKFPVISTLWGKKGTYNVAISDAYLVKGENGQVEIYVDGIEQEFEEKKKEFLIYPEQFSDVAYFVMYQRIKDKREFSDSLALKEIVNKHGLLPSDLKIESGHIKNEFKVEYSEIVLNYTKEIDSLIETCYHGEFNWDDIKNRLSEMACELADLALIENHQKPINELCNDDGESLTYKEDVQDEFNDLFDDIEGQLADLIGFDL